MTIKNRTALQGWSIVEYWRDLRRREVERRQGVVRSAPGVAIRHAPGRVMPPSYSMTCSGRGVFHRPFMKSGNAMGAPFFATDCSLSGETAARATAS